MKVAEFNLNHVKDANILTKENYEEERKSVPILPNVDSLPDLTEFANNGLGVAAYDGNKMLGFLCYYPPLDNAFTTTARGTFSPIHAHGAVLENRAVIYKKLYQAAAIKWVDAGSSSHAIALYAHDNQAIDSFFINGFGMRCIDAIRETEEIQCSMCDDLDYYELKKENVDEITVLRRMLSLHLSASPCFMQLTSAKTEAWIEHAKKRNSRVFVASQNKSIIAFFEIMDDGENFACDDNSMKNICGAFCLPEYRGRGAIQNLLNFMIRTLKKEGYSRLGVDFESFNSIAYGFWTKYFTPYTKSLVRRIDESAFLC